MVCVVSIAGYRAMVVVYTGKFVFGQKMHFKKNRKMAIIRLFLGYF